MGSVALTQVQQRGKRSNIYDMKQVQSTVLYILIPIYRFEWKWLAYYAFLVNSTIQSMALTMLIKEHHLFFLNNELNSHLNQCNYEKIHGSSLSLDFRVVKNRTAKEFILFFSVPVTVYGAKPYTHKAHAAVSITVFSCLSETAELFKVSQ